MCEKSRLRRSIVLSILLWKVNDTLKSQKPPRIAPVYYIIYIWYTIIMIVQLHKTHVYLYEIYSSWSCLNTIRWMNTIIIKKLNKQNNISLLKSIATQDPTNQSCLRKQFALGAAPWKYTCCMIDVSDTSVMQGLIMGNCQL